MITLSGAVGEGGDNRMPDVRLVQAALNKSGVILGPMTVPESGLCDQTTVWAIRQFQQREFPFQFLTSGLIKPADDTIKRLSAIVDALPAPAVVNQMSGKVWWHANQASYPNSSAVADLAPGFREKVETFIAALRLAGAIVTPNATRRNKTRAYLMHYSFRLAKGKVKAKDIPKVEGCNIIWDHGDDKKSRAAAQEMVALFAIVFQPSLTSLHIAGNAIDMNISWSGTMKIVDGKGVTREIGAPASGAKNAALHKIGASYGVHKLLSDAPHWSSTGH